MRKPLLFSAVLSLFLLIPASITWAQTITTQKGLTTAVFNTQYGNLKVYLPDIIRPGETISGTIVAEAIGKNIKQVEKNLNELGKYNFKIDGFSIDARQSWSWQVQKDKKGAALLELFNEKGNKSGDIPIQLSKADDNQSIKLRCISPSHAVNGSPIRITGPFDGDASNTKCSLDGKELQVLAESNGQCIISYPTDAAGIKSLNIQEKETQICSQQISSVQLNVSAGKLKLLKGEKTYIDVAITGLQNLPDTAILTLNNISTGIVKMLPSDNILIPLSPDSLGFGNFNKRFDIQSLKSGSFIVNVDLDLPEIQYEIKKLNKPRRLADESLHTGLSQAIKKLEADAGGAQGKEYSNMCENCQKCIRALAGSWAEDLVRKLGEDLIKESVGKAIGMFMESKELLGKLKEMLDKASDAADKAEKLAEDLEKKIRAGELQLLVFQDQLCKSNMDCVVSAMIFYDPTTGCVTAFVKCNGRAGVCCPKTFNTAKITYCTDEKGMPKDIPHVEVVSE